MCPARCTAWWALCIATLVLCACGNEDAARRPWEGSEGAAPAASGSTLDKALERMRLADPFAARKFDRGTWWSDPEQRGPMTNDLIESTLSGEPTESWVRELLGTATEEYREKAFEVKEYYLGMWSGARIDPDHLKLRFHGGRLVRATIVQH